MGNYNNNKASSNFSTLPSRRYYNLYTSEASIKGDAANADGTAGFYSDSAYMPSLSTYPWITRGREAAYVSIEETGIFCHKNENGASGSGEATRFVLGIW